MNPVSDRLDLLLKAVNQKGFIIDEHLIVRHRFSLYWIWLKISCPVYWLFGSDAFSHVKAVRVAQSIFIWWQSEGLVQNPQATQKVVTLLETLKGMTRHDYREEFNAVTVNIRQVIYTTTMQVARDSVKSWDENHEETDKLVNLLESLKAQNYRGYKDKFDKLIFGLCKHFDPTLSKQWKKIERIDRAVLNSATIYKILKVLASIKNDSKGSKPKIRRFISKKLSDLPIDIRIYFDREKKVFPHIFLDLERSAYGRQSFVSFDLATGEYHQRTTVSESEKSQLSKYILLAAKMMPRVISIFRNVKIRANPNTYTLYQSKPHGTLDSYLSPGSSRGVKEKIEIIEQLFTALEVLHNRGHAHLSIRLNCIVYQIKDDRRCAVKFEDLRSVDNIDEIFSDPITVHPDLFALKAKLKTIESGGIKKQFIADLGIKELQAIDIWDLGIVLSIVLLNDYSIISNHKGKWFSPHLVSVAKVFIALRDNKSLDFDQTQKEIDKECKECHPLFYENMLENLEKAKTLTFNKSVRLKEITAEYNFLKDMWDLVSQMLKLDSKERIAAKEVFKKLEEIISQYDRVTRKKT